MNWTPSQSVCNHYDAFFSAAEYHNQNSDFIQYCYSLGLVSLEEPNKYKPKNLSIAEALALIPETRT